VFAERGFDGASVDAICMAAGLTTGALYSNFKGKDELFLALYEERIERRRQALGDAVKRSGGGHEGLVVAAESVGWSLTEDKQWFVLYFEFALYASRNAAFARRFESVREEGLAELISGLRAGLAHTELDHGLEVDELARTIRALSYGLALDQLIGGAHPPGVLVRRVLEVLLRDLRSTEPPPGAQAKP
jgi:AcrR family transcriptional regulator